MLLKTAKLAVAAAIFAGFLFVNLKQTDPDLGWHLRVGEQILTTGEVPHHDAFSHTMEGFEWVDHEWLADAWFWWMRDNDLWSAMAVIFALLAAFPFIFWTARAKRYGTLWIILLAALSMSPFTGIRPQILSLFMFFVVFQLLSEYFFGSKALWKLAVLPPLFLVWANLHGGFFSGLALFAVFIFAEWTNCFFTEKKLPPLKKYSAPVLILFASALLPLANPYGFGLYGEIFRVITSLDTTKYIQEWVSVASSGNLHILLFLAVFLAFLLRYFKHMPLSQLIVALIFLILGTKSQRNYPLFLITAVPVLFLIIEIFRNDIDRAQKEAPFRPSAVKAAYWAVAGLFVFSFGYFGWAIYHYRTFKYPEKAVDFLEQKIKSGEWPEVTLLNEYGWGGYLIWRLPEVKVFIDGRMPHWQDENGNSAMKDYMKITRAKDDAEWREILERRKINAIMSGASVPRKIGNTADNKIAGAIRKINEFMYGKGPVNIKEGLLENGWTIAYEDEQAVIFRK